MKSSKISLAAASFAALTFSRTRRSCRFIDSGFGVDSTDDGGSDGVSGVEDVDGGIIGVVGGFGVMKDVEDVI